MNNDNGRFCKLAKPHINWRIFIWKKRDTLSIIISRIKISKYYSALVMPYSNNPHRSMFILGLRIYDTGNKKHFWNCNCYIFLKGGHHQSRSTIYIYLLNGCLIYLLNNISFLDYVHCRFLYRHPPTKISMRHVYIISRHWWLLHPFFNLSLLVDIY